MENTNKHNKLIAILITLTALVMASILIYMALKNNSIYYYTPSDYKKEIRKTHEDSKIKNNTILRLGGLVGKNSLMKKNNKIYFRITDGKTHINIIYEGVLPDLFKENAGAIVEGIYNDDQQDKSTFIASKVLAKHDENYKPPTNYHNTESNESESAK